MSRLAGRALLRLCPTRPQAAGSILAVVPTRSPLTSRRVSAFHAAASPQIIPESAPNSKHFSGPPECFPTRASLTATLQRQDTALNISAPKTLQARKCRR